jgi:uncharacterized protein YndB with AHSA1/START domain
MQREVRFEVIVRAEPVVVFDAMATANGLNQWFTHKTTLDGSPGGALVFRWRDWGVEKFTGEMVGEVVEARSPETFVFKWPVDSGGYMTTCRIDFETHAEGTLVRLVEGIYEDGDVGNQDMLNRAGGWGQALTLLKFWVEHGLKY